MVRVGSLLDLMAMEPDSVDSKSGWTPARQLEMIFQAVVPLIRHRDAIWAGLCRELASAGIRELGWITSRVGKRTTSRPGTRGISAPSGSPDQSTGGTLSPHLKNKALYCAALLQNKDKTLLGHCGGAESLPAIQSFPEERGPSCAPRRSSWDI